MIKEIPEHIPKRRRERERRESSKCNFMGMKQYWHWFYHMNAYRLQKKILPFVLSQMIFWYWFFFSLLSFFLHFREMFVHLCVDHGPQNIDSHSVPECGTLRNVNTLNLRAFVVFVARNAKIRESKRLEIKRMVNSMRNIQWKKKRRKTITTQR